jgi:hypothetical protein
LRPRNEALWVSGALVRLALILAPLLGSESILLFAKNICQIFISVILVIKLLNANFSNSGLEKKILHFEKASRKQ